ncbi:unnamed protein product [Amoebophrya sp. A25]|nr:unnamed protein product [Amoebophrya sp. A25]|eukprot:GSA25T00002311001.1
MASPGKMKHVPASGTTVEKTAQGGDEAPVGATTGHTRLWFWRSTSTKSSRGSLGSLLEGRLLFMCAFYLGMLVFFPPLVLYSLYLALWCGSLLCRVLWLFVLVDYLIPLKTPGMWTFWCMLQDDTFAKTRYWDAEVVSEFFSASASATMSRASSLASATTGTTMSSSVFAPETPSTGNVLNKNLESSNAKITARAGSTFISKEHEDISFRNPSDDVLIVDEDGYDVTDHSCNTVEAPDFEVFRMEPRDYREMFQSAIFQERKGVVEKNNYLVLYHPHSLFGVGHTLLVKYFFETSGAELLFTGADIISYFPFLRRVLVWWGYTKVSAPELKRNLKRPYPQNFLTLLPGGIAEMFYGNSTVKIKASSKQDKDDASTPSSSLSESGLMYQDTRSARDALLKELRQSSCAATAQIDVRGLLTGEQVVLRKRTGFCRIALQSGASLVPVYAMGANQVYNRFFTQDSFFSRLSSKLQTSLVVWTDRLGVPFGCVPFSVKMVVVIGRPIPVERESDPTAEQISALHERYIRELRALFDRHKHRAGWGPGKKLYLEDEDLIVDDVASLLPPSLRSRSKKEK